MVHSVWNKQKRQAWASYYWGFRRNRSLFPRSFRSLVPRSCRSRSERSDAGVCHLGEVIGIRQESFVVFSFLQLFCPLRVGFCWAGAWPISARLGVSFLE